MQHIHGSEETTTLLLFPIEAALIIFLLWVLWTIAISLKGMDESFKEIARKFRDQNQ